MKAPGVFCSPLFDLSEAPGVFDSRSLRMLYLVKLGSTDGLLTDRYTPSIMIATPMPWYRLMDSLKNRTITNKLKRGNVMPSEMVWKYPSV